MRTGNRKANGQTRSNEFEFRVIAINKAGEDALGKSVMNEPCFEVRFPRSGSAVGSIIGLFALWMCMDYGFLHQLAYTIRPQDRNGLGFWGVLACILFSLAITLKTVVRPSLMFAARREGVEIGSGIFWNRIQRIPWTLVREIGEGAISERRSRGRSRWLPALVIVVDSAVTLNARGFDLARRTGDHTFAVASTLFREPLKEVIARSQAMKMTASEACAPQ